jgi:Fungal specific transcription factor domain
LKPKDEQSNQQSPTLMQLKESLPPKVICDCLLNIYSQNFEKVLRVLHFPSFLRQYDQYWIDPDIVVSKNFAFLPQLTAVMVISLNLEDRNVRFDDIAARTYLECDSLDIVSHWLGELSRKQRAELSALQVETLLVLARHLRNLPAQKLWIATGALLRSAMTMGLHLDPSQSDKIPFYQAENRRRLWITIVEMDIQASVASGMPLMAPDCDFSRLTPTNINDVDYDENTDGWSASIPPHEWTDSLPQRTLALSMAQRIRILQLMRNVSSNTDLEEVLREGRKLEERLRQIPSALRLENAIETCNGAGNLLTRVLLDAFMRRPLLCLYRSLLVREEQEAAAFQEMQHVCLESSKAILTYQDYFDPEVADLDIFGSNSPYWDMLQTFCKNDIIWAALSICQYIKSKVHQATTPNSHLLHNGLIPIQRPQTSSKATLTRMVENTLDGLTRRIGEVGSDLKDVLLLAVVLQSVRIRSTNSMKYNLMYEGTKKALWACRQTLLDSVIASSQKIQTEAGLPVVSNVRF